LAFSCHQRWVRLGIRKSLYAFVSLDDSGSLLMAI